MTKSFDMLAETADAAAEALVTDFMRIKDPEVRASILALVLRLAEASESAPARRPLLS